MDEEGLAASLMAFALLIIGVLYSIDRGAFHEPWGAAKVMGAAAIILVFLAVPFAVADGRARSRFRAAEKRLRAQRPGDDITEYVGPEGDGLQFSGPTGRLLLLRPVAGLGAPRIVHLPPPPSSDPVNTLAIESA